MENPEQIITRSRQYGKLFEQLRKEMDALGYRLLAPGELDPYTIERCAKVAKRGYSIIPTEDERDAIDHITAAIRALKGDG